MGFTDRGFKRNMINLTDPAKIVSIFLLLSSIGVSWRNKMPEKIVTVPYIIIGVIALIVIGYIAKKYFDHIIIVILQICFVCLGLIEWMLNGFLPSISIVGPIYLYTLSNFIPALLLPWLIISVVIYNITKKRFTDRDNVMLKVSISIIKSIVAALIIVYLFVSLKLDLVQSLIIGSAISLIWGYKVVKEKEKRRTDYINV